MPVRRGLLTAILALAAMSRLAVRADSLGTTILNPTNGATNVDASQPFRWTKVTSAQTYYLALGTGPGKADVWGSGEVTVTSLVVPSSVPRGKTLYVRVWTKVQDMMHPSADVTFAFGTAVPTPPLTPTPTPTPTFDTDRHPNPGPDPHSHIYTHAICDACSDTSRNLNADSGSDSDACASGSTALFGISEGRLSDSMGG